MPRQALDAERVCLSQQRFVDQPLSEAGQPVDVRTHGAR